MQNILYCPRLPINPVDKYVLYGSNPEYVWRFPCGFHPNLVLMKKILLWLFVVSLFSFGLPVAKPYTQSQIEAFVREVFADQADVLVLKSNSNRLALIEGFLSRIEIRESHEYAGKKVKLLSEVTLQNKYNPNLVRDAVFNPAAFNPLKYCFPMVSKKKEIYRFDKTDYLIIIQPVK
jgi:hypothetical protein